MADKEYIDREAAKYVLRERYRIKTHFHDMESAAQLKCAELEIGDIPAADVRPMVKAEWLPFGKRGIYGMMYACSSCRAKYDGKTNFCPNCGADMRAEAE